MNAIAKPLALLALVATIAPPLIFMFSGVSHGADGVQAESVDEVDAAVLDDDAATSGDGSAGDAVQAIDGLMTQSRMQNIMLAGAILWFISAPAWLKEND